MWLDSLTVLASGWSRPWPRAPSAVHILEASNDKMLCRGTGASVESMLSCVGSPQFLHGSYMGCFAAVFLFVRKQRHAKGINRLFCMLNFTRYIMGVSLCSLKSLLAEWCVFVAAFRHGCQWLMFGLSMVLSVGYLYVGSGCSGIDASSICSVFVCPSYFLLL